MPGLIDGLPDTIALTCLAFVPYYLYPKLELVSRSWKAVFRSVELFKERQVVGLYEDYLALYLYFRGESHYVWKLYDPLHKFWIALPTIPSKTKNLRDFGVVSTSQKIFIIGGRHGNDITNDVWSFDLVTRTWSMLAPMLVSHALFACCVMDGKIVVAGGYTIKGDKFTSNAEMYDIEKDAWISLPDLHRQVNDKNLSGFMIGGKMQVGSEDSLVQVFDSLEMKWRVEDYKWSCGQKTVVRDSLYVGKWIQEAGGHIIIKKDGRDVRDVSSPRRFPALAAQMIGFRGELYMFGGMSKNVPREPLFDVHILNVGDENPTWRYGTPMSPRYCGLVIESLAVRI